jgi:aminoglycoside phosphotransferase (APT) family kinase protein
MQPRPDTVHIDPGVVERLVAAQFPQWAHLPVAPVEPGGWDNRTFRLGAEKTVRLPSASHYAGAVDREQRWLPKLAPRLPLPVPQPLAMGRPTAEFPWNWSVYNWLEGETATAERVGDMDRFAAHLAGFLRALQTVDTAGGPTRKLRGGSLSIWDERARTAIDADRKHRYGRGQAGLGRSARCPVWQPTGLVPRRRGLIGTNAVEARSAPRAVDEILRGD